MPAKKYHVRLSQQERDQLAQWSRSRRHSELEKKRARILLLADEAQEDGPATDAEIAAHLKVDALTVSRVRQRFGARGLLPALVRKEQQTRKARALDGAGEAHLIALVCSAPPEGRTRWSLHLLKDTLIEQRVTDTISHEAVRRTLKKMNLSPG
jgi:transposase